jgi:hypothetical protein
MIVRLAGTNPGYYSVFYSIDALQHRSITIPGSVPRLSFWVDAPLDSWVSMQLQAVDGHGHKSAQVQYSWRVTGQRTILPPGTGVDKLHMVHVIKIGDAPVSVGADHFTLIAGKRFAPGKDYIEISKEGAGTVFLPGAVGRVLCVENDQHNPDRGSQMMLIAEFPPSDLTCTGLDPEEPTLIRFYASAPHVVHAADGRVMSVAEYLSDDKRNCTSANGRESGTEISSLGSSAVNQNDSTPLPPPPRAA